MKGTFSITESSSPVFLKLFSSIANFSFSTRRFSPPSLIKQTKVSKFERILFKESIK